MNVELASKVPSVLLSYSRHYRLVNYCQQKVPSQEPVVQQLLIISPFGIFPLPPRSFSDIAHFRMDGMSQPLYWPSERPAERTYPEWAMGGRVVCGGEPGMGLCAVTVGRAIHCRGGEAGSSPGPSTLEQQGRAAALVTPGSCC